PHFGPVVEIDDVLVHQPDAAGRDVVADRVPLGRAVQPVTGIAALVEQIERTGAERVHQARIHAVAELGKLRLAPDHLGRRRPARPFALQRDMRRAVPLEAFAADADAVAYGPAVAEN